MKHYRLQIGVLFIVCFALACCQTERERITSTPFNETLMYTEAVATTQNENDGNSSDVSLYYAGTFNLPAPECSFLYTNAPSFLFYTCPEQTDFEGLWALEPSFQSEAVHVASSEPYSTPILSPNGKYLAYRAQITFIQVIATEGWHTLIDIPVSEAPAMIQYIWLPDSSGLAVTYPSDQSSLEIFYLSGKSESILYRNEYDSHQLLYHDGGIGLLNMGLPISTQNELFYKISDPDNYRPQFYETYLYDLNKKQSSLLIRNVRNDGFEKFAKNVFNFVGNDEIIVSFGSSDMRRVLGYYAVNINTQAQRLVYPLNTNEIFTVVGESFENNMIAVVTSDNKHRLVNLRDGTEIITGVQCPEILHTQWLSTNDLVVFCNDSVWSFDIQAEEAAKVYDQALEFSKFGIWEWYENGQQMLALRSDDKVSIIYFK